MAESNGSNHDEWRMIKRVSIELLQKRIDEVASHGYQPAIGVQSLPDKVFGSVYFQLMIRGGVA